MGKGLTMKGKTMPSFIAYSGVLLLFVLTVLGCSPSPDATPPPQAATPDPAAGALTSSENRSRYIRNDPAFSRVIVFIHGFTGDSTGTWTNDQTGAFWPDLLTQDATFDGYNIYIYGYESERAIEFQSIDEVTEDVRRFFDEDGITDHQEIVLLVHSMGGVVARAYLNKYRDAAQKVNFIYFFATPTTGTKVASRRRFSPTTPS
jgi:pimeloyl-ACP methyl ester carboxylesterase